MKIHFASLFGVDYDMDIFPYWSAYYADASFDTRTAFLHREEGNIPLETVRLFESQGFRVVPVSGKHHDGMIRKITLDGFAASLPKEDFIVTADADEFHSVPDECLDRPVFTGNEGVTVGASFPVCPDYRRLFMKFDILTGFLIDRYALDLSKCVRDPFLQYPYEEKQTLEISKSTQPFWMKKSVWHATRRTKILGARNTIEINYQGSHIAREIPTSACISDDYRVIHFAWRESSARKLSVKSYFSKENLHEAFDGSVPPDVMKKYEESYAASHPDFGGNA